MEERSEPHCEDVVRIGGCLHDGEDVIGEVARRPELGDQLDEHARFARDTERLRRARTEQELRQLAHPVRGETPADALARDELDRGRLRLHLASRLLVELEAELRDETQSAHEPQRILGEAGV